MLEIFAESTDHPPLSFPHFPSRLHAVIWRNWGLVPAERLASVLRAQTSDITGLAVGMGLPNSPNVSEHWLTRGYITLIRANWHLLPYEQLLTLLGWKDDKLAYTLQEDDFLWIKLGRLKPAIEPVYYLPPTETQLRQMKEMREIMHTEFPDNFASEESPFQFLDRFYGDRLPERQTFENRPLPDEYELGEKWIVVYPEGAVRARIFADRFVKEHAARWGRQLTVCSTLDTNAVQSDKASRLHLEIAPDPSVLAETHTIEKSPDEIRILAVDEVGLLRGLQHLTEQMASRGAPYLKAQTTRRKTRFDLRFIYSYFAVYGDPLMDPAIDPFPEGLLAELSRLGVNGIWLQGVLYTLVPWDKAPELSRGWETRIATLRMLTAKAAEYGIGVYLYFNEPRAMPLSFFENRPEWKGHMDETQTQAALCTSHEDVRGFLKDGTARLFREVPELAGLFTITMSEGLTNCYSRAYGGKTNCPVCARRKVQDIVAEVNTLIADGAHSVKPDARIIAWTWGYARWLGWNRAMIGQAIRQMPSTISIMCTSEEELPTSVAGIKGKVVDYSISVVGPGSKAKASWKTARSRGMPVIAKVQLNNTWENSAVPYLPAVDLIREHLVGLKDSGVSGLMLSWSLGGYPSFILDFSRSLYWDTGEDDVPDLESIARGYFGESAANAVCRAWTRLSQAFREFPFHVDVLYTAPQNIGPANLFHFHPTGYKATLVCFPYDDLKSWRAIYPPDVFEEQFRKLADGWAEGVALLESALKSGGSGAGRLEDLIRVSRAAYIHFRSTHEQIRFVRCRDRYLGSVSQSEKDAARAELLDILAIEKDLAIQLHDLVLSDSRIGFEATNHYYYTVQDLREKVLNCVRIRKEILGEERFLQQKGVALWRPEEISSI